MPSPTLLRVAAAVSLLGLALSACSDGAHGGPGEDVGSANAAINPISGCDYSFARPTPSSLTSMGYQFAARYLSGDPGSGKDITAAEATSLKGGGLDVVLVWESTGTDATNGYNQGVSDATAAASEATTVGEPGARPIYFAIDFEATSSDSASINAYFQGVASVIGLSRTGVYGGYYIVNELFNAGLITFGWQTYAWSGGSWDSRAQLRQTQNGVDNDELDADEGMVADFGQWGPNAPAGADYAAEYVSQSFPLAATALDMVEGQTIPSYIELKNTGTKTWDSNTHLATTQPRDRVSVFADSSWISTNRPAGVTGTVPPGGTFKFQFNLHAPSTTGTYLEYFGVVEEGVAWFSDPGQGGPADNDLEVQIVVSAPEYRGTFVSQTYPGAPTAFTMHVGETTQGSITLTNSGTKPWVSGTTKLAPIPRDTASPFATSTWLSTQRVSSVAADVQPGANGTFSLSLKATTVGDFEVELGLVDEAITWFADAPLGGGPTDGFLRVHVTVLAADVDAGTDAATGDAGLESDGSIGVDAATDATDATDAGEIVDAGFVISTGHDAGHPPHGTTDAGHAPGSDDAGAAGEDLMKAASAGGCSLAHGESPSLAPLALLGLAAILGRRKTRRG